MNSKNYSEEQKNRLAMALIETIEEIQFAKDMADFREGRADNSIRIPSREERQAIINRIVNPPIQLPDWLSSKINRILAKLNPLPELTPGLADDGDNLESQIIKYQGKEVEVSVFIHLEQNEIEIYTSDVELIGKKIVIHNGNDIVSECVFVADNTRKNMKAVAFLKVKKDFSNAELSWKIED